MKILVFLIATLVAGCAVHKPHTDRLHVETEHHLRENFVELVKYIRTVGNKPPTNETRNLVIKMIEQAGFSYVCKNNSCYMLRDNMKVRIHADTIEITYADGTYQKLYEVEDAIQVIYS